MTALRTTAECTYTDRDHPTGCGWTTEGPRSYPAAEKHTRTTGHGTTVRAVPIEVDEPTAPIDTTTKEHR